MSSSEPSRTSCPKMYLTFGDVGFPTIPCRSICSVVFREYTQAFRAFVPIVATHFRGTFFPGASLHGFTAPDAKTAAERQLRPVHGLLRRDRGARSGQTVLRALPAPAQEQRV